MQLNLLFKTLVGLQTLASGAAVVTDGVPRMDKRALDRRPGHLTYIRSWDSFQCAGQGKFYYDFIISKILEPDSRTFWNEPAREFRYTFYDYWPVRAQYRVYFHTVTNDGFDQYRFSHAESVNVETLQVTPCTFFDEHNRVITP